MREQTDSSTNSSTNSTASRYARRILGGLVVISLLSGCSSDGRTPIDAQEVLRPTLVALDDMGEGWEALWDPTGEASKTDPRIEAALGELERCVGSDAPAFMSSAEPTVTGATLIGGFDTVDGRIDGQVDSHAYSARGLAGDLPVLVEKKECMAQYVRQRIIASVNQGSLEVSEVTTTVLDDLPKGVTALRFEMELSNGSETAPLSSTMLVAGSGSFVVFYDISSIGGAVPSESLVRLADQLINRVTEVTNAL